METIEEDSKPKLPEESKTEVIKTDKPEQAVAAKAIEKKPMTLPP